MTEAMSKLQSWAKPLALAESREQQRKVGPLRMAHRCNRKNLTKQLWLMESRECPRKAGLFQVVHRCKRQSLAKPLGLTENTKGRQGHSGRFTDASGKVWQSPSGSD
ncbi:hypothetical protein NDU88_000695 [Pleurodeles waltl]|uniref:Uncharacterized protein n=1 Tax=Pleurodeles waltl TaxID=8319 RepID=A0AAV7UTT9_PLEWA|nr:hypothetical protein NDU88_000695 [Pleurodeles waltl]